MVERTCPEDAHVSLLNTVGSLIGDPAVPQDRLDHWLHCIVTPLSEAIRALTRRGPDVSEADAQALHRPMALLTALARGMTGLPKKGKKVVSRDLPNSAAAGFATAAQAVLEACQTHGHRAPVREAAVAFLDAMMDVPMAEQLGPVAGQLAVAVMPVADVTEAAAAVAMVAHMVDRAPPQVCPRHIFEQKKWKEEPPPPPGAKPPPLRPPPPSPSSNAGGSLSRGR